MLAHLRDAECYVCGPPGESETSDWHVDGGDLITSRCEMGSGEATQSRGQLPTAVFVRHFSSSPSRMIGVTLSRADRRDRGPTSCSR
jgi:hypothetical protein